MSELERLREEVGVASRSVAELVRTVEALEEARAEADADAERAEHALAEALAQAESVPFATLLWQRVWEGWGLLGKLVIGLPMVLGIGAVVLSLFFDAIDDPGATSLEVSGVGAVVGTDGPLELLGAPCQLTATSEGHGRCRAALACDGATRYDGEVGCAVDERCEGSGDDETCWDALVLANDEPGAGFRYDSDLGRLDADAEGVRLFVATEEVGWEGTP